MTKYKLIGSAPTLERLTKAIQEWFYNPLIKVVDGQVIKADGNVMAGLRVIKKKNRYRFERIDQ